MVNLSMNQTLARSINTSLVAIMPVLSVLVIGSLILGATTLQSFGLALVIGLTSGAYSSIFIASPLLALMKEREPRYITIRQRLEAAGRPRSGPHPGHGRGDGRCRRAAAAGARPRPGTNTGVIRPGGEPSAVAAKRAGAGRRPADRRVGRQGERGSRHHLAGRSVARGRPGPPGNRPPPRPRKGKGKGKGKRR